MKKTTIITLAIILTVFGACSKDESLIDSRCSGMKHYNDGNCIYILQIVNIEDSKMPTYPGIQKVTKYSELVTIENGEVNEPVDFDNNTYAIYKNCDICNQ